MSPSLRNYEQHHVICFSELATCDEETETHRDAIIMTTDGLCSDISTGLKKRWEGIFLAFIVENTKRTYLLHPTFYVLIAKQTAAVRKQN